MTETGQGRASGGAGGALRIKKPGLKDPRLIIGTLLVVGSVAGGAWAMDQARANLPVYVAAGTLTPGTQVTQKDLAIAEVRLGDRADLYLEPGWDFTKGFVITQTINPGEFIPLTALQEQDQLGHRVISIPQSAPPAAQIVPGVLVDLWHTPKDQEGGGQPVLVAANLTVSEIPSSQGALSLSSGQVHVVVAQADVPAVLAAAQAPGTLALLPAPGGAK